MALSVVVILLPNSRLAAAEERWSPISPEELAETSSKLLPGAVAEILELKVELDDSAFPQDRVHREYLRAKIYAPTEKMSRPVWLDANSKSLDDNRVWALNKLKLSARLTLPNGTSKIFSKEEIEAQISAQSRTKTASVQMLGNGWQQVLEHLITACRAEPGSILEYKLESPEYAWGNAPYDVFNIQGHGLAIRQLKLVATGPAKDRWFSRYYVLHQDLLAAEFKKTENKRKVTLEASEIPARVTSRSPDSATVIAR